MKRFLLFVCPQYYPRGGWKDFQQDYDTLAEAHAAGQAYVNADSLTGVHIVDTDGWIIVEEL